MKLPVVLAFLFCASGLVLAADESLIDSMRGNVPINEEATPPRIAETENADIKRMRNYPMQPPTIPHKIDNYQLDLNVNKCLSCHARSRTYETQAPMISVTHYLDRDNQFLAEVSPRRYFCLQCHVVQTTAKPLVANSFRDIDQIMATPAENKKSNGGKE